MSCCDDRLRLDLAKMDMPPVVWTESNFIHAAFWIVFTPVFWTIMSRIELQTQWLSRMCRSPYVACGLLSFFIIVFLMHRNFCFQEAVLIQRNWWFFRNNVVLWLGHFMFITGAVFVAMSFWKLGYWNTFLGDYFGLVMTERVTSFPYTVSDHPMYWGSAMMFMGYTLGRASLAGFFLACLAIFMYRIIITFEGRFTDSAYAENGEYEESEELEDTEEEAEETTEEKKDS